MLLLPAEGGRSPVGRRYHQTIGSMLTRCFGQPGRLVRFHGPSLAKGVTMAVNHCAEWAVLAGYGIKAHLRYGWSGLGERPGRLDGATGSDDVWDRVEAAPLRI